MLSLMAQSCVLHWEPLPNSRREEREGENEREIENREVHCRSSEGSLLRAICFSSEIALLFPPGRPGNCPKADFFQEEARVPLYPARASVGGLLRFGYTYVWKGREDGGVQMSLGIAVQGSNYPCLHQCCLLMLFLYRPHQLQASRPGPPWHIDQLPAFLTVNQCLLIREQTVAYLPTPDPKQLNESL